MGDVAAPSEAWDPSQGAAGELQGDLAEAENARPGAGLHGVCGREGARPGTACPQQLCLPVAGSAPGTGELPGLWKAQGWH